MKKLNSNKGITLTTLVVTVIVLLILVGVATSTGIEAIENTKHTKFVAELKIMQSYVNQWYEDLKKGSQTFDDDEIAQKFGYSDANSKPELDATAQNSLNQANILSEKYKDFYLLDDTLKQNLGVEGGSQSVLVNIKERKIVSYLGLKYKNAMYYTIDDQSGNGIGEIYNVEYDASKNTGTIDFDVTQNYLGNGKTKIIISNIHYVNDDVAYNNKWNVKYKKQGQNDNSWQTSKELTFIINDKGTYQFKVENEGIKSAEIKNLKVPPLAKDTLTIINNYSPYVWYYAKDGSEENKILCRVLYNDENHGLQLISNNSVRNIKLGGSDENVNIIGTTNLEKAQNSYMRAITTLNEYAENYLDKKNISTDARCIGSLPSISNNFFTQKNYPNNLELNDNERSSLIFSGTYNYQNDYEINGKYWGQVYNMTDDYKQLNDLNIKTCINNGEYVNYWSASYNTTSNSGYTFFSVIFIYGSPSASWGSGNIWFLRNDGYKNFYSPSYGFRPVFLINNDVKIKGNGDGTAENPYILAK